MQVPWRVPLNISIISLNRSMIRLAMCFVLLCASMLVAQPIQNNVTNVHGTVVDPGGRAVQDAAVVVKNETAGVVGKAITDAQGTFTVNGVAAGTYTVEVSARGFTLASRAEVKVSSEKTTELSFELALGTIDQAVTVEATVADSVAAQLAPMDGILEARSA